MHFCDGKNSRKERKKFQWCPGSKLKGCDKEKDINVSQDMLFLIQRSITVFTHLLRFSPSSAPQWTAVPFASRIAGPRFKASVSNRLLNACRPVCASAGSVSSEDLACRLRAECDVSSREVSLYKCPLPAGSLRYCVCAEV